MLLQNKLTPGIISEFFVYEMMFFKITKSVTSVEITNNTFKFLITDFDFTKNCNQKSTSNMN